MDWSQHIPLVTLIAVVFSAGTLYSQHAGIKRELRALVDKTVPRLHKRLDGVREWQIDHDAAEGGRKRVRTAAGGVPISDEDQ